MCDADMMKIIMAIWIIITMITIILNRVLILILIILLSPTLGKDDKLQHAN